MGEIRQEEIRETVLKVSLAGLFHDIGKFARGSLEIAPGYRERNADLYQPYNREQGRHTHQHALYTAAFIETYTRLLPRELNSPDWGLGEREDSFINLSAKHHKPETPLQQIVTQADCLSSGLDRAEFEKGKEIGIREYKKTRLVPIFEYLLREKEAFNQLEDFHWCYPLAPLSALNIFPKRVEELDLEKADEEYRALFEGFVENLEKLSHPHRVELWAEHFDSLLRIYTSHIPAARVGRTIPDVSLYDHLRTTAALAGALYLYHQATDTLEEKAIKDNGKEKFLLISGDFYGIQNFIFRGGGEERHHRAKLLRGRSFLVSLMMELVAHRLCEEIGLSFLSIFLSAAGKFHLLAPNIPEAHKAVETIKEEVNRWLYDKTYGECAIGFAKTSARPEEFLRGRFFNLWQEHLKTLEEAKFNRFDLTRYGGAFNERCEPGYLDRFHAELSPHELCPLCGRRPSSRETESDPNISRQEEKGYACTLCRDQVWLGKELVRGEALAVLRGDEGELREPLFGRFQLKFVGGDKKGKALSTKNLLKLYELNVFQDGSLPVGATFLPINGYVPVFTEEDQKESRYLACQKKEEKGLSLMDQIEIGVPKTFHHIAQLALSLKEEDGQQVCYGLPALGVLKADVDNLGAIFGCGLKPDLFTISRLATVSRQLNNFFTIYLPYALSQEKAGAFQNIYTVFAGGDDLFLIGPWTEILELASFLYSKFKAYVCENPELHFSAGITFHKPYVPVDLLAQKAEEALSQAKGESPEKNRLSLFGKVATWEEFDDLRGVRETLRRWYEEGCLSRRSLYRLNELAGMAEEEDRLLKFGAIPISRLQCFKWRAFLRYFLVRQLGRAKDCTEKYEEMVLKLADWLARYRGRFILALWPLLYETRKQKI